jgi:hypothetical protein
VLLCTVLHFVPDEQRSAQIVQAYRNAITPWQLPRALAATATDYLDRGSVKRSV